MRRLLVCIGFALILTGCVLPATQTPPAVITQTPGITVTVYPTFTPTSSETPTEEPTRDASPTPTNTPVELPSMTPTNQDTVTPVPEATMTPGFSTPTQIGPDFTPTWEVTPVSPACWIYPCFMKADADYIVISQVYVRDQMSTSGAALRLRPVGEVVRAYCLVYTSDVDYWISEEDCFSPVVPRHWSAGHLGGKDFFREPEGPVE